MNLTARGYTVAQKVTGIGISCVVSVMVMLCIAVTVVSNDTSRTQMHSSLTEVANGLARNVDLVDEANTRIMARASDGFSHLMQGTYSLDINGNMLLNGEILDSDYRIIDLFTRATGSAVTVFVKRGDDFFRIATSVRDKQGARAVNSTLDRTSAAYAQAITGTGYAGRTTLYDTEYMAKYVPVKDVAGKVIGLQFVGVPLNAFQESMQQKVSKTKLFRTGGVMLIDVTAGVDKAYFVAHPTRQGLNAASTPEQRAVLTQLIEKRLAPNSGGLLDQQGANPWAVSATTANGWLAVVEVSDAEAMVEQNAALLIMWVLMALSLVMLAISKYYSLKIIVGKPLQALTEAVALLSEGNLTQEFRSRKKDDLGALIRAIEVLRTRYIDILRQVNSSSHNIASASSQIALGNADLSERTERTAANLARAAQNIEEVSRSVMHTADSAAQAQSLSKSALGVAEKGGQAAEQVNATMGAIKEGSVRIADIISVIEGIAFQTNILALNAAVEAARAGEQGRGFAVVAAEVRSLAGRSAAAAKEIKALIESSVDRVEEGGRLVDVAGATMNEIIGSVERVSSLIEEMAAASREQVAQANHVSSEVNQLDQLTQQNAALVEESAAASASMREQADVMEQTVSLFKLPPN